ncbi:MAG TPA: DUF4382 domain-containing protein [Ferruginibacter sp.]|nr:DUF4382 domain-containing protein [Ferruginibacter sp.]
MKIKKPLLTAGICLAFAFVLFSCQKEAASDGSNIPAGKSQFDIMLTDDPSILFDSIFINIQKVEVKTEDSAGIERWEALNIRPGIYNILRFRNGLDTLLATGYVPTGEVKKIRISIGNGNYAMKNGVTVPLTLHPSDAVLTLDVSGGWDNAGVRHFRIWLDVDGHGSIRLKSDGTYELRLKLSHFCRRNSGEIEGEIKPSDALPAVVQAVSGNDTLTAIAGREGEFKIRGIRGSSATIIIRPSNGYKDSVINNVPVRLGEDTKLGKIVLHR